MLNIHPAIVHTPIGLLTLYSMLEILRFKKLLNRTYWFYVKAVLVIVGFGGSLLAIGSGLLIKSEFVGDKVVEVHFWLGIITAILYGIIAFSYLVAWIQKEIYPFAFFKIGLWKFLVRIETFIQKSWILVPLSVIALVAIFITGALGGAIVYGPEIDPMVSFVYHLFFKEI